MFFLTIVSVVIILIIIVDGDDCDVVVARPIYFCMLYVCNTYKTQNVWIPQNTFLIP